MSESTADQQPDIGTLSFEQAQAELETIVERLEDQHTGLEEALALWERGEALHAYCQQKLDYAAARIEKLQVTQEDAAAATAEPDAFVPEPASTRAEPAPSGAQPAPSTEERRVPAKAQPAVREDTPPSPDPFAQPMF